MTRHTVAWGAGVAVAALAFTLLPVAGPLAPARAASGTPSWAGVDTAGYSTWQQTAAAWDTNGQLAGMRIFDTGTVLSPPSQLPADGRVDTLSWNPVSGTTAAGQYDSAVQALINSGQPIYLSEQHEPDVTMAKGRKNFNYDGWITDNKYLLSLTAGTTVTTCVILSAYWMGTDLPKFVAPLVPFGLTCVGIDFDGVNPAQSGGVYPHVWNDLSLSKVPDLRALGITTLLAPEFGSKLATWDPTGTLRAAWIAHYADQFRQNGFAQVDWFSDGVCGVGGYGLCDAPSIAAWSAVIAPQPPPPPPDPVLVAAATVTCSTGLTCTFDATPSTDPTGTIVSWAWTFGDGAQETDQSPTTTHTYSGPGTYPLTLTVTDDAGATATWSGSALASAPVATEVPFVADVDANVSSATPSVTEPAGVAAGDTQLLFLSVNTLGVTGTPTGPGGWTQIAHISNSTLETTVWIRTAAADDPGKKVTVPLTKAERADLQLVDYRGVAADAVTGATATDATTGTHIAPALAVPVAGTWVLNYWSDRSTATSAWTLPSTLAVRKIAVTTGSSARVSGVIADSGAPVPIGTYPSQTAKANSTSGRGDMISLVLPAAG